MQIKKCKGVTFVDVLIVIAFILIISFGIFCFTTVLEGKVDTAQVITEKLDR